MQQDPRTFVATADPDALPAAVEGSAAQAAVNLNRVQYVAASSPAGVTANVEELGAVIVSPQPLQGLLTAAVLYTEDQLGGAPNGFELLTSANVPTPTGFEFDANPRGLITFSVDTQSILGTSTHVPLTGTLLNGATLEPQLDADFAQLVAGAQYGLTRVNAGQPQFQAVRLPSDFVATGAFGPDADVAVSIFTPTAGHRFRLFSGEISVALALDAAGTVIIELYDGDPTTTGIAIKTFLAFMPAATPDRAVVIPFDFGDQGYFSQAVDTQLFVLFTLATAASIDAGSASVNANLMEEGD